MIIYKEMFSRQWQHKWERCSALFYCSWSSASTAASTTVSYKISICFRNSKVDYSDRQYCMWVCMCMRVTESPACGGQNISCAVGFSFHLLVSLVGQMSRWQAPFATKLSHRPQQFFKVSVMKSV